MEDIEVPEQPEWPDHSVICTYAVHLPFPLRLADRGVHRLVHQPFEDPTALDLFPDGPYVQIRIHNAPCPVPVFESPAAAEALKALYGFDSPIEPYVPEGAYEQWVSLETPSPRLVGENPADRAYTFHRCLRALNRFLTSHNVAFHDNQIHPVTAHEIGPVVLIGQYELSGEWSMVSAMLVHPERLPNFTELEGNLYDQALAIGKAYNLATQGNPFWVAVQFAIRGYRAGRFRGDYIDQVVSLQAAFESRLYATWGLLLVDLGYGSSEVAAALDADYPFKSLVVTTLAALLGGRWDIAATGTPVGDYWQDLYLIRNRVVHAGFDPGGDRGAQAIKVYDQVRYYIRERCWKNRWTYPRTTLAVVGKTGMEQHGWSDAKFEEKMRELLAEPMPYHLPWDIAKRPKPAGSRPKLRVP